MRHADDKSDDVHAALAEELDAETLQAIAARHDDYADREAAIADLIDPREGARTVYPEDDIVRDIYAAIELHRIDDEELVADLCHAAANVGDSLEGTRRDDIRWAADRRMSELCNDEMEPLVTPGDGDGAQSASQPDTTDSEQMTNTDPTTEDETAARDDHEKPTNDRGIVKPEYYIDDEAFTTDVTALPGIGQKTAETLADEHDVETVADMILAQLGDGEGVFDSIAVYDELTDALREYEDYDRYDAYPVTGEDYDGPHEVEDWWYYDEVAPIYATAGDRIRLRVADEQWTGEVRDVALEPACRVVLTIDADGETYNVVYDDGEWRRMTSVERRKDDTVDVEIIDDRASLADDEAQSASQPDTTDSETMTDTDSATEDETAAARDDNENTEANQPLYDVCEFARLGDDKTGRRYLDQLADRAISRAAADRGVREDDLRRALYALGRCLPHDEMRREARGEYAGDEDTVRYEADEYLVDASEHYHNTLSDLLSREFDDLEAAEADMEASGYSPDEVANFDAEAAAEHYRDRLRSAMTAVMEAADETDYDHPAYPCSYPMVILREADDRLAAEEARDLAEQMVEERTEVKTRPTWEGTRTVGIDRPYARSVAEDVADQVEGATVYVTEEQRGPTVADAAGRGKTAAPVEVAVISLADGEVAVYPGGQRVELRDADNGGDAR